MASKGKEKALATKEAPGALDVYDYGDEAGEGFEGQSADHLMIPFFSILQSLSPQIDKESGKYVDGAEIGKIYNTVSEELHDEIELVPVYKEQVYVEWVPRSQGGGFVGIHQVDSDVVKRAKAEAKEFGKYLTPEGNELAQTFYVYVIRLNPDGSTTNDFGVLAFTSTKIKKYRRWNTAVSSFQLSLGDGKKQTPPLFAHRVRMGTVREENKHGVFYNYDLGPACTDGNGKPSLKASLLPPGHETMAAAKQFAEMVRTGLARAAHETSGEDAGTKSDSTPF